MLAFWDNVRIGKPDLKILLKSLELCIEGGWVEVKLQRLSARITVEILLSISSVGAFLSSGSERWALPTGSKRAVGSQAGSSLRLENRRVFVCINPEWDESIIRKRSTRSTSLHHYDSRRVCNVLSIFFAIRTKEPLIIQQELRCDTESSRLLSQMRQIPIFGDRLKKWLTHFAFCGRSAYEMETSPALAARSIWRVLVLYRLIYHE